MTKINESFFTENAQFQAKVQSLINNTMYSSAIIGFLHKNYLVAIDSKLYLFNSSFDYYIVDIYQLKIGHNNIYTHYSETHVDLIKFDSNLKYPLILGKTEIKNLNNYINSLHSILQEMKANLPILWINNQHLKPYFVAYYKKYRERFDLQFLRFNSWLTLKTTLENPLIVLNDDKVFLNMTRSFPNDIINFKRIISNKMNLIESDLTLRGLIIYGLRQVGLEFNNDYFNENFPELTTLNTTNIQKLLLALYQNSLWGKETDKFLFYYLSKNHLLNKLNSEQLEAIYSSIVEIERNIQFDYKTIMLENELELISDIEKDITSPSIYTITDIDLMSGSEFEVFCGALFEKLGYSIEMTPASGDQGIDLIACKEHQTLGIQAKRYSKKVTNTAIQEVAAGIKHYRLQKGLVITNSYFTDSAIELATSNDIILWDRYILEMKLKETFNN